MILNLTDSLTEPNCQNKVKTFDSKVFQRNLVDLIISIGYVHAQCTMHIDGLTFS